MELKDLRKSLKGLGCKVKTESFSFGRSATIVRKDTNEPLPSMFMGESHRQEWIDVLNLINGITVYDTDGSKISGPWS